MTIKVWNNFSKRRNSTKRPTGGTDVSVVLKDNVNIESPSFILSADYSDTVYIMYEGSYYWVDSITRLNNTQILVSCSMDSLATYKDSILATRAMCMYSTAGNPSNIPDTRNIRLATHTIRRNSTDFRTDTFQYKPVIATVSEMGVNYYDAIDLGTVLPTWSDLEQEVPVVYTDALAQTNGIVTAMQTVMQSILDCYYIPCNFTTSGTATYVRYGQFWTWNKTRNRLSQAIDDRVKTELTTIAIPWGRNDWRRQAPYSQVYLYIPYFGMVDLTDCDLANDSLVTVKSAIDQISGDMRVEVQKNASSTPIVLKTLEGNVAVKARLGIAGSQVDKLSQLTSALNVAGSVLSSGSVIGAISNAGNIVGGVISALNPPIHSMCHASGACSGTTAIEFGDQLQCIVVEYDTAMTPTTPSTTIGLPDGHIRTLNTLSGFVQTVNASVSITGTPSERDYINSMLDSGVYLE